MWGVRESVPSACAEHWGVDRGYEIPLNSTGETFAFVWSSCEEIGPVSVPCPVAGKDGSLFEIYPNPVLINQINLSFRFTDRVNLTVMDMQGKLVYVTDWTCFAGNNHSIDLHNYREGAYLVRIFFPTLNRYDSKVMVISK